MKHWTDPADRGVYAHPAAHPPVPQPRTANDIPSRVSRLETHQEYMAHNAWRAESESRMRAMDLGAGVHSLDRRIATIERDLAARQAIRRAVSTSVRWGSTFGRWLLVGILAVLYVRGTISLDGLKAMLKALGFPAG